MARRKFTDEKDVNDFYDEKKFKADLQYESRTRDIDRKLVENDERILAKYDKYYATNEALTEQRNILREKFESRAFDTTNLEAQIEIKRNRYTALETQWALTEDSQQRDIIKAEAIREGSEIEELESRVKDIKDREETARQSYEEKDSKIVKRIEKNYEQLEKVRKFEDKQDELTEKRAILTEKYEEDLSEIERKREEALENLPKGIPPKTIEIEFFAYGKVSPGSDRYLTVTVKAEVTVPSTYKESNIESEDKFLLELCEKAWQYVEDGGEKRANVGIGYEFSRPDSKGIYHFDERMGMEYKATDEILIPEGFIFKDNEYIEEEQS